ncbi:IclR family transcriptional regulator [Alicyclobacillus fastidiosus]|uniref:IclR family transcriptional regulator n=1 Tax=Alicyclobacillus fastidiosus TaxID=392011 RepID=A0ABY6ZMI2_9BACL|nr:IclR family transcriptional regulator [Alicyclobacillus fastidiosus]WAH43175.1 IclR family transcriptional regulator [Alicyclobacillus fastidiosus]GMA65195.1 transcriptional regulator [Alicyclobacillus fastidiosus]
MSDKQDMTGLGIQSVEIGIDILKTIGHAQKPLSISEIAERCDMSKSRLHRYLTSLYRTGFLSRDTELRYSIGPELMSLGLLASSRWTIRDVARPTLIRLKESLNETVALSVWTEKGPYFLHWEESNRAVNIGIRVGTQVSAIKSVAGKIFLAFLPERDTEDVLKRELAQFGVSRAVFDREIQEIRSKGYSITEESLLPGILAIGCPVFGRDGRVVAAISVVGILGYLDPSEESPVVTVLKQECQKLSDTLT